MSSGGPGSGLFKSTDGGETWTEITRNQGLPQGMVGRIGVALTKADSNRVYALVENEKGGLYVSDDAGATWRLMNESRNVRQRAFYYTHVHARPAQQRRRSTCSTRRLFRSTDAGKTTRAGRPGHAWRPSRSLGRSRTTPITSSSAMTAAAPSASTSLGAAHVERSGLSDRAVVSRRDDRAPAVPRLRRAAGQQHAVRAEQHQRRRRRLRRRASGRAVSGRRRRAGLHRARPHRSRCVLRRRQQRHVPHALQPPHRRAEGSRRLSALLLRRAVERRQRTLAVDLPDHLFATSIRRCSTRARSACGDRPTAATRGKRSAAI